MAHQQKRAHQQKILGDWCPFCLPPIPSGGLVPTSKLGKERDELVKCTIGNYPTDVKYFCTNSCKNHFWCYSATFYGNLPTLKLKGFLLSYKDVFELDPHLRGDKGLEK